MSGICVRNALGGRLLFNVLVKDVANAREVWEASEGFAVMSIVMKDFPSLEEACDLASAIKEISGLVSLGLGGGDPSQWHRVVDAAIRVNPGHINQVFPETGYTIGALNASGITDNVVNALVAPSPKAGHVVISTGPLSEAATEQALVPCSVAFRMIKEVGGTAVKVFPIEGSKKIEELRVIARLARAEGMSILEPTGGITTGNIGELLEVCLDEGSDLIIPHVHSSIVDKASGRTNPDQVAQLVKVGRHCLGIG